MSLKTEEITQAVQILQNGGLVGMPTETVYGLAADASNPIALKKIFAAKQRPIDHPLIVHIASPSQITQWAIDIPETAWQLASIFCPGALTLILKKAPHVLDEITGKQSTVAIRIPSHPVALQLLELFGKGLAAPSANRFGRISPTTAQAVRDELGNAVDIVLDGGQCEVGVESTILDLSSDEPTILRLGMISAEQIESVLKIPMSTQETKKSPRVSGAMDSHYAPELPTRALSLPEIELFLSRIPSDFPIGLMTIQPIKPLEKSIHYIKMPDNVKAYAYQLYSALRTLDNAKNKLILIEKVPEEPSWDAVRDRLQKASSKQFALAHEKINL